MLRRVIGEDVDLRLRLAEGLDPVEADAGQIERVVMNLGATKPILGDETPEDGQDLDDDRDDDHPVAYDLGVLPRPPREEQHGGPAKPLQAHLADRLEAKGFLVRERVGTDRRGAYAVLTERGRAALRQAWPIYAAGIAQHFVQHLTAAEIETLTAVFARVLRTETPADHSEER